MKNRKLNGESQNNLEKSIRLHARGFESSVRDLSNDISNLYERGNWRNRRRANGKKFETFREFAEASTPYGLGLNADCGCLTVDALATRIAVEIGYKTNAVKYLGCKASDGVKQTSGNQNARKNKSENRRGSSPSVFLKAKCHGTKDQQKLWLQLHHPQIWKRFKAGEFRTVNAAMTAAGSGVVASGHLDRCRRSWNCLTAKERRQFLADIKAAGRGRIPSQTERS